MSALKELVQYLRQHEIRGELDHIDAIVDLVLKVLSERSPSPKVFAVMPVNRFEALFTYQEANIISQFPLPVDLETRGIGTVPSTAVNMGRYGLATELNKDYWKDGCIYCRTAEAKKNIPTLFDLSA